MNPATSPSSNAWKTPLPAWTSLSSLRSTWIYLAEIRRPFLPNWDCCSCVPGKPSARCSTYIQDRSSRYPGGSRGHRCSAPHCWNSRRNDFFYLRLDFPTTMKFKHGHVSSWICKWNFRLVLPDRNKNRRRTLIFIKHHERSVPLSLKTHLSSGVSSFFKRISSKM